MIAQFSYCCSGTTYSCSNISYHASFKATQVKDETRGLKNSSEGFPIVYQVGYKRITLHLIGEQHCLKATNFLTGVGLEVRLIEVIVSAVVRLWLGE